MQGTSCDGEAATVAQNRGRGKGTGDAGPGRIRFQPVRGIQTMHPRKTVAALAFAAAFAAGASATYYAGQPVHAAGTAAANLATPRAANSAALPDFASIAQQYGPSVVNIAVSGTRKTGMRGGQDDDEN